MLGKLAYRNTKRNIKDYLIYLITVTASVSLISIYICISQFFHSTYRPFHISIFILHFVLPNSLIIFQSNQPAALEYTLLENIYQFFPMAI